ncbi:MAG: hypothetical protein LBQ02_02660 [Candidatus Nomurabacteria bacterium]|nr:hypothetical protein [Candidatus Nomurabacteria bacterium]
MEFFGFWCGFWAGSVGGEGDDDGDDESQRTQENKNDHFGGNDTVAEKC